MPAKVTSAQLIDKISNPRRTYFDIFSDTYELELVDLTCSTQLLANFGRPKIILTELCRWNDEADVYYGKVGNGESVGMSIAVKIGQYMTIADEAVRYRSMHKLYTKTIPACLGLYGLVAAGMQLGVLILERFGMGLKDEFIQMSRVEKTALLNHLLELHSLGIMLNDLVPSNVLESDFCSGDLRLIDFADIELEHRCSRAARPGNQTYRFRVEDAGEEGSWEFPALCPDILYFAQTIDFWDNGIVIFLGFRYKVDEVPSDRIMQRLKPVNWMRVFAPDVQDKLFYEWFRYIWQEIQEHGLKNTLETALEKLDAWEQTHLAGYPREREWMYPNMSGAKPYAYEDGLVKIPYKAEGKIH
ncbi:hypothetical protein CYLTODRAFT_494608 [Cylindrobasidium torrendii FP15055 ss-10]|uniref:Protein kinase domain-containing protein n=1 Tax=Cylindrobasidium torrendii FP15055 ss-10 TaxID=1314674 RepID=A0A0D7AW83_9AGAR|nr:hypothetical protein CYLTODRAFT_494608 [Cylindrobasidium torrendii FP15055 ss-10]